MANTKTYSIVINGINESVKAVDSLNDALGMLEQRMKNIQSSNANISGSGSGSRTSNLAQEDKLMKEIQRTEQDINNARREEYQSLLANKDLLKEVRNAAQERAATERLEVNNYANSMEGLKQKLADIKKVMQTTDLGSDKFKELTVSANEVNTQLLEIEKSYGQFGRNVGNYASAVEGFQSLKLEVNGTTREFSNAREALRTLTNERNTLKLMGEDVGDLDKVVKKLQSDIKDMSMSSAAMDNMLDTMQSIVAIASVGKGVSAFFGLDSQEIEKSIQKLVALQNVLQGIETVRKQMQTGEGIGMILSKGNKSIDKFTVSIMGATKGAKLFAGALKALKGIGLIAVISLAVEAISKLISKLSEAKEEAKKASEANQEGAKAYARASIELENYQDTIARFNGTAAQEKKLVDELNSKYGESIGYYKTLSEWKDALAKKSEGYCKVLFEEAKIQYLLNQYVEAWAQLQEANATKDQKLGRDAENKIKTIKKQIEEAQENMRLYNAAYGLNGSNPKTVKDNGTKTKNAVVDVEKDISQAKVNAMKDGLRKTLAQLELERQQRIAEAKKSGRQVAEQEKLINQEFDNKVLKAKTEYHDKRIEEERQFQENLLALQRQTAEQAYENSIANNERELETAINALPKSERDKRALTFDLTQNTPSKVVSEYIKLKHESENIEAVLDNLNTDIEEGQQAWEQYVEKLEDVTYKMRELGEKYPNIDTIANGFIGSDLTDALQTREVAFEDYYSDILELQKKSIDYEKNLNLDRLKTLLKDEEDAETKRHKIASGNLQSEYDALENDLEGDKLVEARKKVNEKIEQENATHENRMSVITKKGEIERQQIEDNAKKQSQQAVVDYYSNQIREVDNAISAINAKISNAQSYNAFGILNISSTKKNLQDAANAIESELQKLAKDRMTLDSRYTGGEITFEQYKPLIEQNDALVRQLQDGQKQIKERSKDLIAEFLQGIDRWVQALGQSVNSILSSFSEIQSNKYDAMIEEQEKYIDKYEDLLDKQRDATQQYSDSVNQIENDLSDARGDRRELLIDKLNAEMAAQRESIAQERKLEREREKAEEKRKKLEIEKAKQKKKMDLAQAYINAAMAVSNAAVNHWPVPAIPMMALAAAVGAAQIAAVQSQNIPTYATGGVIEGKSHKDGGVKVLGGRAEVEGGEFITNKATTSKNVELLEFVNSKKRRLDLSDMIDFYGNSTVRKNVTSMKTKFASGGQIPTLSSSNINLGDRLLTAFEDYANRPSVVSVVDIIDRTNAVNEVKALAGLQ